MLKAGGSKHHRDLLAPFGLDASDPAFWDKGLGMIAGDDRRAGGDGGLNRRRPGKALAPGLA